MGGERYVEAVLVVPWAGSYKDLLLSVPSVIQRAEL